MKLEKKKSEYSSEALRQAALEKIETFDDVSHIIYTDGSTSGRQENGGAGMMIQDADGQVVHEASFPAGAKCSSYTGECCFSGSNPMVSREGEREIEHRWEGSHLLRQYVSCAVIGQELLEGHGSMVATNQRCSV